jgi:glycosyltransferase involved in cell wall biosynthesis
MSSVRAAMPEKTGKPYTLMLGTAPDTMGGVSSVIVTYRNAGLMEDDRVRYVSTHTDQGRLKKVVTLLAALSSVIGLLAVDKPALIHVHSASRASFWRKALFMALARAFGIPYVIHLHGAEFRQFYEIESNARLQWIIRDFFKRAAAIVVLSEQWRHWVAEHCPSRRIEVIHNPVELPDQASARPGERSSGRVILSLGRLGPRKGTFELITAFARIAGEFPDARLVLGGDGELCKASTLAAELGLQARVECVGWVTGNRKEELLRNATVYALPSHNEGLPISVLEAMAHGLAIVTTPVGGIPDAIVDGVTGLMVPPGDVDQLANALHRLLRDPALCESLGANCVQAVRERFAAESVVQQVRSLHAQLIAEASH